MSWPDEATTVMVEMWERGCSAGMIAERLNNDFGLTLTRSAVLGKIHRKHMQRREDAQPKFSKKRMISRPRNQAARRQVFPAVRVRVAEPYVADDVLDLRTEHSKTILELTTITCRWPCGEPTNDDFFFCGRPSANLEEKRPYCAGHTWRAQSHYLKPLP